MKKYVLFPMIAFFLLTLVLSEGCKKDKDSPEVNTNMPGTMMTLSSISYAAEGSSASVIKDSITILLADQALTTGGDWSLVWGPGISANNENLVYVAKSSSSASYAVVIRGTNIHSIGDLIQDVNVFTLVSFPYGKAGDSVSAGAMDGLANLLGTSDPVTGANLETYLNSIATGAKPTLYITGHSLGGALSSLVTYWLITNDQLKDKFVFSTFTFAAPGFVNESFKNNLLSSLPSGATYTMKVNSLDMIPYAYSDLEGITTNNIPVHVPLLYRLIITVASDSLQGRGIHYFNVKSAESIGNIPIGTTGPGGITPSDTIQWYDYWVGVEHSSNNYLKLLGAQPLK
ncbi:MAG: hypothetical protein IH596_04410 [Bacteroidales bacterium]|nr:hypothetical protein [Bacteroidales bacterium]